MEMSPSEWRRAMGLEEHEVPRVIVLEGSWWRGWCQGLRLPLLDDVRELDFPDIHLGWWHDVPVAYAWVYGAPRAVEPVHALGMAGTPVAIQIGSCGGLQPGIETGHILLPDPAVVGEGASQYYDDGDDDLWACSGTPDLLDRAAALFRARDLVVHRGQHLTTSALFSQPPERVHHWRQEGHLGVDMETSAVFTAARAMGMRSASLLFVWDELLRQRTFLSAYTDDERERQRRANEALFEVALETAIGDAISGSS